MRLQKCGLFLLCFKLVASRTTSLAGSQITSLIPSLIPPPYINIEAQTTSHDASHTTSRITSQTPSLIPSPVVDKKGCTFWI